MTNQVTSSPSSEPNQETKRIELLFSKFAAFYGHIWRSQFKDESFFKFAKKEWAEGLKEFSDSVINQVITQCRDGYELPPTLPQVIQDCRKIKNKNLFYVVAKHVPAHQEIVRLHLKKCKELLTQH